MTDYRVFDPFQDSVLVLDGEGKVVYGNVAASILFEVSARRLSSGKPLSQFLTFEPNPFAELASVTEASQVREVAFTTSSGKAGSVQAIVQPQPHFFAFANVDGAEGANATVDGEQKRYVLYLRDVSLEKILADKYKAELDSKEAVITDLKVARAELEDYSKNLEKMVAERTAEIAKTNALLRTILDSLGQGILVFGADGLTLPVYSEFCKKLFGDNLVGRPVEQVLGFDVSEQTVFANWRDTVFQEMLDFEDLTPLAPERLPLPKPTEIALSYNRMVNDKGSTAGVVVVATDRTAEVEAKRIAEKERAQVRKIVQVARHREAFRMFVQDALELMTQLMSNETIDQVELERRLHTLKGGSATFALDELAHVCHDLETALKELTEEDRSAFGLFLNGKARDMKVILDDELAALTELLGPLVRVSDTAVSPEHPEAADYIKPFESSLCELAKRLNKKIGPMVYRGDSLRLPPSRFQKLFASFVHAYRNAVDHGLEAPEVRVGAGKPEFGTLGFATAHQGNLLTIEIFDDGRGVDVEKVRAKLRAQPERAHLAAGTDDEVAQVILLGDLSTADQITEVSGRGVGLSAVAEETRKLGGDIRVHSQFGIGMKIVIHVPISDDSTVAIDADTSGAKRAA